MIRRSGIALAEILLVTVLLGILASIIVPHISGVGPESRTLALARDLRTMRSRIERYKCQHNGQLPAGKSENFDNFLHRMARKTNANGCPGIEFGPYLQRIPVNPCNDLGTVRIDGAAAGANTDGWRFDTGTGAFQADNSAGHAAL